MQLSSKILLGLVNSMAFHSGRRQNRAGGIPATAEASPQLVAQTLSSEALDGVPLDLASFGWDLIGFKWDLTGFKWDLTGI